MPMTLNRLLMAAALCGAPSIAAAQPSEDAPKMHAAAGWTNTVYGAVRAGYEWVDTDPNYDFVGANDGFVLHRARLGLRGQNAEHGLSYDLSFEGATDVSDGINTPQGHLDARLRDAFVRWDPSAYIGVQLGQFKAPLIGEEMRSLSDLLFIQRAVGVEGVPVGRGFEQRGLAVGRQMGLMLSPAKPITIAGDMGAKYYLMVGNGNGANQSLDDNGELAMIGRVELNYGEYLVLGGGAMMNARSEGTLPNLIKEEDLTIAGDLLVKFFGVEVFGQFIQRTTSYVTVGGTEDRKQQAFHGQINYELPLAIPVIPGYRFASFDPWGNRDDVASELTYHTVGVRVIHPQRELGLSLDINYTLTGEEAARELNNDRLEALVQLQF